MAVYKAPLRDMQFVLKELIGLEQLQKLPGGEELSEDLIVKITLKISNIFIIIFVNLFKTCIFTL